MLRLNNLKLIKIFLNLDGYTEDNNLCKLCHFSCLKCSSLTFNDCTECD